MADIQTMLGRFSEVAANPKAQLAQVLAQGKKAVGVLPPYGPQELIYAAGMVPFGVWGSDDVELREAKKYFPAFICSVLQTALELGLRGGLNGLSAVTIPALCDSLKCMGQNWKAGVPNIPFIPVFYPQNRKTQAGVDFLVSQYREILAQLEEISGSAVTDAGIERAIEVYNSNRAALRRFSAAAATHPQAVSPAQRSAVLKSGWFMDRAQHTLMVNDLCDALEALPQVPWKGKKVVLTGILADSPGILQILADNGIAVVADEVAAESRQFRTGVPEGGAPLERLARHMGDIEGCSLLYDPQKKRGGLILDMVKKTGADGVIVLQTKFCDPEEFDYAVLKKQFEAAGVPHLLIEVDRQTPWPQQAGTAIQTFVDVM